MRSFDSRGEISAALVCPRVGLFFASMAHGQTVIANIQVPGFVGPGVADPTTVRNCPIRGGKEKKGTMGDQGAPLLFCPKMATGNLQTVPSLTATDGFPLNRR